MELKRYRKARGLTQEEAAAAIGIPTKTYQNDSCRIGTRHRLAALDN